MKPIGGASERNSKFANAASRSLGATSQALRELGRRRAVAFLAVCFLVAATLRGFGLDLQSLWLDEFLAFHIGQRSFTEIWGASGAIPGQSPFYYFVIKIWTDIFGRDDASVIRSLSVILGLVNLCQVWWFLQRFGGRTRAHLALAILAVSPAHIYYSQEARMYALLAVLVIGVVHTGALAVREPTARGPLLLSAHAFLITAALYTHYYAALFIAAFDLWLLIECYRERRSLLLSFAVAQAAAAIAYLPWIPALLAATASGGNTFIRYAELKGAYTAFVFALGYSAIPIDAIAKENLIGTFLGHWLKLSAAALAFGWLAFAGVRDLWKSDRGIALLSVVLVLFPIVTATLISILFIPSISERYFSPALPFFVFLLASGMYATCGMARWLPVGIVVILTLQSLVTYYTDPAYGHHDWRQAVNVVRDDLRVGDLVAVHPSIVQNCFDFYAEGQPHTRPVDVEPEAVALPLADRVWFVVSHPTSEEAAIRSVFERRYVQTKRRLLPRGEGIDVTLYERNPP